jgi:DNA-binding transcriptional regulator YhcF (GntR family)
VDIEIDQNSRIPLYLQIEESIKRLIAEGQIKKGSQLPTERELSIKLGVSRNTVSMAYKELVQGKIVSSASGKGTFVIANGYQPKSRLLPENSTTIIKNIDLAIQKALELNVQVDDFMYLVNQRLNEKKHLLNNVSVAFIECNQEQLYYFSKKLELGTGIHIIPILIDEMYNHPENFISKIEPANLVVTTFFHLQEVQEFLKDRDKKIIAIALDPQIETMVNIARVTSPEMRIGLVCLTQKFAERVFKSIKYAGIKYKSINYTTTHENKKLKEFISKRDILLVSPGRKKEVKDIISGSTPLIEFMYIPDKGSIDTLKKTIFDIKKREVN